MYYVPNRDPPAPETHIPQVRPPRSSPLEERTMLQRKISTLIQYVAYLLFLQRRGIQL
jgi:hypothetical protein